MLRVYDYRCDCGVHEHIVEFEDRDNPTICEDCGALIERLASAPAIHTLETHFRGYRGEEGGHYTPSFGEYRDPNLTDEAGNPLTYSSTREKRKLLEARGLYELPPRKKEKQIFGKKGRNRKTDKQVFTQKRAR